MRKMTVWNEFRKMQTESFHTYWIRFDRLVVSLELLGIAWPVEFIYAKAMRSVTLNNEQRTLVTTAVEVQQKGEHLDEFRRIVVKLSEPCPEKRGGEIVFEPYH